MRGCGALEGGLRRVGGHARGRMGWRWRLCWSGRGWWERSVEGAMRASGEGERGECGCADEEGERVQRLERRRERGRAFRLGEEGDEEGGRAGC